MSKPGQSGASLGGRTEMSPERKKRAAAKRKREEARWARKSGPVTVRFVDPATLRPGERVDLGGDAGASATDRH